MLQQKETNDIIHEAGNLFTVEMMNTDIADKNETLLVTRQDVMLGILHVIQDAGLTYISTADDLRKVWNELSEVENGAAIDWLMQATITWRVRCFRTAHVGYDEWVDHLASVYSSIHVQSAKVSNELKDDLVVMDVETLDRFAIYEEYKPLLHSNPWFVYLVTLQLSGASIQQMILRQSPVQEPGGKREK